MSIKAFLISQYGAGKQQGFYYRVIRKGFPARPEFHPNHQHSMTWRMGQTGFRTDWDAHNREPANAFKATSIMATPHKRVQIAATLRRIRTDVQHERRGFRRQILLGRLGARLSLGSNVQLKTYTRRNRTQATLPSLGYV